jgi:outer membrane protein assembly factor BamB
MDSSKILSLEDFAKNRNQYPTEEESLEHALRLCSLVDSQNGEYPLLNPKNIYIENDERWVTAHPPVTKDCSEALFRLGAVLHSLVTRSPFRISHYLDGPPSVHERNPQISVRFESIIARLLQNIRAMRYLNVVELRDDLERLKKELAGDWTIHWRCFKANGMRTNFVSAPTWNPVGGTLKEIWKASIGDIWGSPVIAGENVFVGSGTGHFYSVDAKTGKVIWKVPVGGRVESSACIDKSTAYIGNDTGMFYAINIRNGAILWKKSLSEYVRSSAYCDGKSIYVGSINPERKTGMLWALSAESGSVLWKKPMGPVFSSPVVDHDEVIIGSDDEILYCFSTIGTAKWQIQLPGKIRSTPVIARDFVYAGGFGGVIHKIRRSNGEIVWRNPEAGSMYSSIASGKGYVVAGNNAGAILYFQVNGGKKKAEFASGGPVTSSPLVVGQFVLVGSNDGKFYILDSLGKEITNFNAQSPINSSASFHDDVIYLGSDQGLHALSL